MELPDQLQAAISDELSQFSLKELALASQSLTESYRDIQDKVIKPILSSSLQKTSYLSVRMPATYAAVSAVLKELKQRQPSMQVKSLLDLGAGPGTAMWAAVDLFPELEKVTLVEQDPALIEIGKRLAAKCTIPSIQSADWKMADLKNLPFLDPHQLVIFSYSLGELKSDAVQMISNLWKTDLSLLVIVEPGTPKSFQLVKSLRSQLIEQNAFLIAPCPHMQTCPMQGNDWCHFSARLQRTQSHRTIKGGTLGFEDEKYSYLIASKSSGDHYPHRILRHPMKHSGHIELTLCAPDNVERKTVSKKNKESYRRARKAEWGDIWLDP